MSTTTMTCFACDETRPVALVATLADGRQLVLCRGCFAVPAPRATFIGAVQCYQRAAARDAAIAPWSAGKGEGLAVVDPRHALASTHQPFVLH